MKSVEDAAKGWQALQQYQSLTDLRNAVRNTATVTSSLRSAYWKAFLLFENLDWEQWPSTLTEARTTYNALREHYLRAIHNPDEFDTGVDPLSETEESPWDALRKDEILRAEIYQDVERCMPENMYFRQPETQKTLVDILFIYCKLNPDIGYRQGMHELLAPILWVVERDSIDSNGVRAAKKAGAGYDPLMLDVLDHDHVEADAFTLYGLIMQNAKSFYDPGTSSSQPQQAGAPPQESPMLQKSRKIFEGDLARVDPDAYDHLVKLEIVPQIYLMRWVRLLFGREFVFDDVLLVWDLLFAEDSSLQLVDQICVAMLLRIHWQILDADTNAAFALLLRYPAPDTPPRTFVHDALQLRNNLTTDAGCELIQKYSGRQPSLKNRATNRPTTPTAQQRPVSPVRSPSRFPQTGSLEAMLQSAAKDVLDRSRKLGINKAVKDAVGEVRKNVQDLQTGWTSPRFPARPSHSRVASDANEGHAVAKLMQRVSALEQRNKQLSQMLQKSVEELWQCQAERAEKVNENKESKDSLEALSSAIAKVQFVQVYLEDTSVPLPAAENEDVADTKSPPNSPPSSSTRQRPIEEHKEQLTQAPVSPTPKPKDKDQLQLPPAAIPAVENEIPPASASTFNAKTKAAPVRTRPKLASSNFSWMLGQEEEPPSRTFVSVTSPHSAQPAEARRHTRGSASQSGKGFLFGDDNDDSPFNERPKLKNGKILEAEEEVIDLSSMSGSVR